MFTTQYQTMLNLHSLRPPWTQKETKLFLNTKLIWEKLLKIPLINNPKKNNKFRRPFNNISIILKVSTRIKKNKRNKSIVQKKIKRNWKVKSLKKTRTQNQNIALMNNQHSTHLKLIHNNQLFWKCETHHFLIVGYIFIFDTTLSLFLYVFCVNSNFYANNF